MNASPSGLPPEMANAYDSIYRQQLQYTRDELETARRSLVVTMEHAQQSMLNQEQREETMRSQSSLRENNLQAHADHMESKFQEAQHSADSQALEVTRLRQFVWDLQSKVESGAKRENDLERMVADLRQQVTNTEAHSKHSDQEASLLEKQMERCQAEIAARDSENESLQRVKLENRQAIATLEQQLVDGSAQTAHLESSRSAVEATLQGVRAHESELEQAKRGLESALQKETARGAAAAREWEAAIEAKQTDLEAEGRHAAKLGKRVAELEQELEESQDGRRQALEQAKQQVSADMDATFKDEFKRMKEHHAMVLSEFDKTNEEYVSRLMKEQELNSTGHSGALNNLRAANDDLAGEHAALEAHCKELQEQLVLDEEEIKRDKIEHAKWVQRFKKEHGSDVEATRAATLQNTVLRRKLQELSSVLLQLEAASSAEIGDAQSALIALSSSNLDNHWRHCSVCRTAAKEREVQRKQLLPSKRRWAENRQYRQDLVAAAATVRSHGRTVARCAHAWTGCRGAARQSAHVVLRWSGLVLCSVFCIAV